MINTQLIHLIKIYQKENLSEENIRTRLLHSGWKKQEIQEAFSELNQQKTPMTPPVEQVPPYQKIMAYMFIALTTLFGVLVIYIANKTPIGTFLYEVSASILQPLTVR